MRDEAPAAARIILILHPDFADGYRAKVRALTGAFEDIVLRGELEVLKAASWRGIGA